MQTTIIVPAKDHLEDLTKPCIESIHAKTIMPYTLIGVDDGSRDQTFPYMRNNCHLAIRTDGIGPGNARNLALQQQSSDYIVFLDNDIICPCVGWLKILINECNRARAGIISPIVPNTFMDHNILSIDGFIDVSQLPGDTMLFTWNVFRHLGYLDKHLSFRGEDTDYCYRAKLAGFRVCHTPRLTMIHKGGGTYQWSKYEKPLRYLQKKYRGKMHLVKR